VAVAPPVLGAIRLTKRRFGRHAENVSTAEVGSVLAHVVEEANVYGVQLPNHDGRAGCAAIPAHVKLNLDAVASHVNKELPKYARPLFLRIVPS
jgi:hypothetical protein